MHTESDNTFEVYGPCHSTPLASVPKEIKFKFKLDSVYLTYSSVLILSESKKLFTWGTDSERQGILGLGEFILT